MGNEKLRAARKASGKTQVQVAKEAGISERHYQNYEYGLREPGVRTAIRIAKALDSTAESIFDNNTTLTTRSQAIVEKGG